MLLWDNWGDERGCDEGHWHAHTRGLPWGLPEVVKTVQQVHCSWKRLLRRGLEFNACTLNKRSPYEKVWKLIQSYLPIPPLRKDMAQGQFLSGIKQLSIQSFPSPRLFASPRLKNLVCPTSLPIAGGRIIGFIPFPSVLVLCEMQSVSSRIWTRVAVSISYDDNHYTMGHLQNLFNDPHTSSDGGLSLKAIKKN